MALGRVLVTGSSGHLGEALVRTLRAEGREVFGLDVLESPFTSTVGSIADRALVKDCVRGVESVFHAATLHKPHIGSHDRQAFVETNVTGTTILLEEAVGSGRHPLRLHQYNKRIWPGARPFPRIASSLDHRGRRPYSEEHLWRDEDGGRGHLRVGRAGPWVAGSGIAHGAVLPRRG